MNPNENTNSVKKTLVMTTPLILTLIGIGVLVLSLIGAGVWFIFFSPESQGLSNPSYVNRPSPTPTPEPPIEVVPLNIEITQVDSYDFPTVILYADIKDENDEIIENLSRDIFEIYEIDENGELTAVEITEFRQLTATDNISINLVMDKSGSMREHDRMTHAINAATFFINYLKDYDNTYVELTTFDSSVTVQHTFTNDYDALIDSIKAITPGGYTALYDAVYSALLSTNEQRGAKCIIIFADGEENSSTHTLDEIAQLAQATGIPIYVIGVGGDIDEDALKELAEVGGGSYFYSSDDNFEESLKQVYTNIYEMQRDLYMIKYTSQNNNELSELREVTLKAKEYMGYSGEDSREYIPVPDIQDLVIRRRLIEKYL